MIPWGGVGCCLSAIALYLLGRSRSKDADVLRSVTRVSQLKDLAQLLDAAGKVLPLIVTVSGRVGSDGPIICEHSGLRGVIVEKTAEQHFLKHNEAGSWIQDSVSVVSLCNEVPWYLDDGTGRTYVVGARGAAGLQLSVAGEIFEESGCSSVDGTLECLQGLRMLGVKRIEKILPTGTSLTVVGEAMQDDGGTLQIRRPHSGPFYVSTRNIDQLIANLGKWVRWYKYASMGFTIFGVYFLAKHAVQYILERQRRKELQKRVLAAAAQRQAQDDTGSNENVEKGFDHRKRDHSLPDLCVICLEQEYNAVFVPQHAFGTFSLRCGHMCCCMPCSSHLISCPLCRRRIELIVRTFRH